MDVLKVGVQAILLLAGILVLLMAILGTTITGFGIKLRKDVLTTGQRVVLGCLGLVLMLAAGGLVIWQGPNGEPKATAMPSVTPSQILSPTSTAASPPTTPISPNPVRVKVLVVAYIDNTGYIDLDGMKVYRGDRNAPEDKVDLAVNAKNWSSRNGASIALSESGGKETCEKAISTETPNRISMGQVQNDRGFCAFSRGGRYAYVKLLKFTPQDNDHFVQVRLSVYQ